MNLVHVIYLLQDTYLNTWLVHIHIITCHVNTPCQQSCVMMSLVGIHITTWILLTWVVPSSWYVRCCSVIYLQWSRMSRCIYMNTKVFLGALQSTTKLVSYEISIGLIHNVVLICVGSCDFNEIVILQKQVWYDIPKKPKYMPSSCINKNT